MARDRTGAVRGRLVGRLILRRRTAFGVLGALSSLVVAVLVFGASWSASAVFAVEQSVATRFLNQPYSVDVNDAAAVRALGRVSGAVPIRLAQGLLSTSGRTASVSVVGVEPGPQPYFLVSGRPVVSEGEMLLTRAAADELTASIGASVSLRLGRSVDNLEIVGYVVDPNDLGARAAVVAGSQMSGVAAQRWVLPGSVTRAPGVDTLIRRKLISLSSLDAETSSAVDYFSTIYTRGLTSFAPVVIVLGLAAAAAAVVALSSTLRRDAQALRATGASSLQVTRIVCGSIVLITAASSMVGVVLGAAALALVSRPAGASMNQYWTRLVVPPWFALAACLTLVTISAATAWLAAVRAPTRTADQVIARPVSRGGLLVWGALVAIFVVLNLQFIVGRALVPYQVSIPIALALAATAAYAVRVCLSRSRSVLHRAASAMTAGVMALASVVGVLVVASSFYAGTQANQTFRNVGYFSSQQPLGSLVINQLSRQARQDLLLQYRRLGGDTYRSWGIPDENTRSVRSASPRVVDCLRQTKEPFTQAGARCLEDTGSYTTLGMVLLDTDNPSAMVRAASDVVVGGRTGLLVFQNVDSYTASNAPPRTMTYPAQVEESLGGLLPAATIGADHELARSLGLTSSGQVMLVLSDFGVLDPEARAALRSTAYSVAPAAEVSELLTPVDLDVRRSGRAVAILGAVVAAGLLVAGSMTLWLLERRSRGSLQVLADTRRRRLLVLLWALPLLVTSPVSTALGLWLAWFANPHDGHGFGWEWVLPGLASTAAAVVVTIVGYVRFGSRTALE